MQKISKETKIVICIISLLVCSTIVGVYSQASKALSSSSVSVLPKSSVLVLQIDSMISTVGTEWAPSIVDVVSSQLDEAKRDKSVKAVVLRVNSPGGTVGASQEIYDSIIRFKETSKKPVVVSIMDIGASGAYWISLAADAIFAHPGSIVGSLGVITQTLDLTRVKDKYGVDVRTYKSGDNKDLLNPWRNTTRDEDEIIQVMLDNVHEQFKDVLIKHRDISKAKAQMLADGRIFSGEIALREGLIDVVGSFYDATQYAAKLAGVEDPKIIYPNQGFRDWLSSFRSMIAHQFSISSLTNQFSLMR